MICLRNTLKRFMSAITLGALLIGFNPLAISAVLVSQPYLADGDSFLSSVSGGFENADSFILPDAVSVTSIVWWGTDANTNDFLVRLGADLGSLSDLSGTITKDTTTDFDSFGRPIFQFEQLLSSVLPLTTGTHLLSISHESEEWYWAAGSLDGGLGVPGSFFGADPEWDEDLNELSFQLIGERQMESVSEPNILALLMIGAFFMGRRMSRGRVVG